MRVNVFLKNMSENLTEVQNYIVDKRINQDNMLLASEAFHKHLNSDAISHLSPHDKYLLATECLLPMKETEVTSLKTFNFKVLDELLND